MVIEIGPGPGGLTNSILLQNPKKLIVIEPDVRCVNALSELQTDRLEIINGDALKIDVRRIAPKGVKLIANLPYNIATVLLFQWLEYIEYFESLTLMFQKEVADRITGTSRTKEYGRVSIMAQSFCDIKHIFDIPPTAFVPQPKITSSVIQRLPAA